MPALMHAVAASVDATRADASTDTAQARDDDVGDALGTEAP